MPYAPRRRAPRRRPGLRRARGRRIATRRGAQRRRSRPGRALAGSALAAIAVVCAGHLAWQFIGTNLVARQHQHQAVAALLSAWDRRAPSTTTRGVAVDGLLRIPRFGSAYAVPLVEGTSSQSLALGVGHVVGSAHPGDVGNVVLAGHHVTHGEPFRELPRLQIGDEIVIETLTSGYVYRVTSGSGGSLRLADSASWVLASSPRNPDRAGIGPTHAQRLITLLTCAELFHTSDRLVVFGELVRTYPRVHPHPEA